MSKSAWDALFGGLELMFGINLRVQIQLYGYKVYFEIILYVFISSIIISARNKPFETRLVSRGIIECPIYKNLSNGLFGTLELILLQIQVGNIVSNNLITDSDIC